MEKTIRLDIYPTPSFVAKVDRWRQSQHDRVSRAQAVRILATRMMALEDIQRAKPERKQ